MNSFIQIEPFPALNELKCTRFRESKQGVDDHIHLRYFFSILQQFFNFANDVILKNKNSSQFCKTDGISRFSPVSPPNTP